STCDVAALWLMLSTVTLAAPTMAAAEEVKTSKERLSDRASENQRGDNCNVPVERGGPPPRPQCPAGPGPARPPGGRGARRGGGGGGGGEGGGGDWGGEGGGRCSTACGA